MPKPMIYDKFYDKEFNGIFPHTKERFLNTIQGRTRDTYRYILGKAYKYENMINKDVYEMSWDELDKLLRTYPNKSIQSVYVNVSCLKLYIDFCIKNGFVRDEINYFGTISGEEYLLKYVDQRASENRYISKERLIEIQNILVNERDVAILELLFLGVKPKEIGRIEITDCDFNNNSLIITKDNKTKKLLEGLPIRTMEIIKGAIEQKVYIDNNGFDFNPKTGENTNIMRGNPTLNNTGYVIRTTGKYLVGEITNSFITNTVVKIRTYIDEQYLTPTNIWMSGLIHYAKQIKEEKGELVKEDYLHLQDRFGINNSNETTWYLTKSKIIKYI